MNTSYRPQHPLAGYVRDSQETVQVRYTHYIYLKKKPSRTLNSLPAKTFTRKLVHYKPKDIIVMNRAA